MALSLDWCDYVACPLVLSTTVVFPDYYLSRRLATMLVLRILYIQQACRGSDLRVYEGSLGKGAILKF